ncbi:extracellular solute-binding protein [Bacillus litorisediminis]|uniref:extracellular solute-binding protein n=1 Tax=Bacillus litorisediminis TaxID=2922713 RepID=UPI001FAE1B92|nr:extracellular solute-binding protein [Bacillus litorisediminis]
MKKNRSLFLILILLLVAAMILSACKAEEKEEAQEKDENFNETGYPIVDEPITLEMMGQSSPLQPEWGAMGFFKEMNEMTNINFEFRTATTDQFKQQKQLAFTSMELPDVFFGGMFTAAEEVDYGSQGLLIPLEGLIEDYAPNLNSLMQKYPDLKASITAPDGHIYTLPGIDNLSHSMTPLMWMNSYWLNNLGLERPKTTEEFYDLLKAFKKGDANQNGEADEIPLTASSVAELRYSLLPAFGINQSDGIMEDNGEVKYAFIQEGYKEYLKYLNRLYKDGLLDQQIFSHTWEQYVAKGAANQAGVFPTWPIVMIGFTDVTEAAKYPLLPALTSEFSPEPVVTQFSEIKRGRAAITSENEHPEATMRWLDYMYSQEGSILARLGVEGENWEWTDGEGSYWRLLAPEGMNTTQANAQDAPGAGTAVPMVIDKEFFLKEDNPTIHTIAGWVEEEYLPYAEVPFPQVYLTLEEQEEVNTLKPDIDSYLEQMEAKFVSGEVEIDAEWDQYVETLKSLGADRLAEINQAAYDRWADAK